MSKNNFNSIKLRKISVIVLICCFIAIFFSGFDIMMAKSRDSKRSSDLSNLEKALDLYYQEYGKYPDSLDKWRGWDLSYNMDNNIISFIKDLKDGGFIKIATFDPLNDPDYHYRYQKYSGDDESYGCDKPFYILQLSSFELATENIGRGACRDLDWTELAPNGYTIQRFE